MLVDDFKKQDQGQYTFLSEKLGLVPTKFLNQFNKLLGPDYNHNEVVTARRNENPESIMLKPRVLTITTKLTISNYYTDSILLISVMISTIPI